MAGLDFYIKQNDTAEAITITATYDDGTLISEDLTSATVRFHMKRSDGTVVIANGSASVIDATNKVLSYQWQTGDTATASPSTQTPHQAEFQITLNDGRILTVPNTTNINIHVFPEIA
jgi:hypothetical protein